MIMAGDALTGPTVPMKFPKIMRVRVEIGRHVIVGAGTVIFTREGPVIGSLSMVQNQRSLGPYISESRQKNKR
jgi:hypothetical protein